jgi:hypothetical protein
MFLVSHPGHGRMATGGNGLPKISPGPIIPYRSTSYGQATSEMALRGPFFPKVTKNVLKNLTPIFTQNLKHAKTDAVLKTHISFCMFWVLGKNGS